MIKGLTLESSHRLNSVIQWALGELDTDTLEPYLSKTLHFYSWWAMLDIRNKGYYLARIIACFQENKDNGTYPLVKLGINKDKEEYVVALQFENEETPTIIRINKG